MMVLTAKVNLKKILLLLAGIAAVVLGLIYLLGGSRDTQTAAPSPGSNDSRVQFLQSCGWEVSPSPKESGRVQIPDNGGEVFTRYNALQQTQGYDLTPFAGKKVMRYVYEVKNYPGAGEPVYATVLVHKNRIIGGDVTDTAPGGHMMCLQRRQEAAPTETVPQPTVQTNPGSAAVQPGMNGTESSLPQKSVLDK